jgi:ATP-dependent DNA helicase RecG
MSLSWTEKGPGQTLEFLPTVDADRLAETLVAFANSDGGTILIGVDPNGVIDGNLMFEEIEDALRLALGQCRPGIRSEWQRSEGEGEGRTAIALRVPRSGELHSLQDGRVLVRSGAENRPLSGDEILHLAATKSSSDFEVEAVEGAAWQDLDPEIVAEYRAKRAERQRRPVTADDRSLLTSIGALTEEGTPTVAGILLFGRDPQLFLPHSGLIVVRFTGTELRGPGGLPGYSRREEILGPLPRLIEAGWQVVWEEMRVAAVVKGLVREEKSEYPPVAVREALVNAVCHREYQLTGRRIEVRMFDDRLELISPGGLPGYITVDNLVDEHFSRNPRLVQGLFQWGFIEELGLGVDRMIEDMVNAGHPPPEFRDTHYSFTVTLKNIRVRPAIPSWELNMNERQLKALSFIQEHKRITNRDYRNLCPNVSTETLRLDLADLVDRGLLLKIGAKKGTYYILKKAPPKGSG